MSRFGLSAALATPFERSGAIDISRLGAHARWCLDNGCDSVTLFGTTGEGASIGLSPRRRAIEAVIASGVAPRTQLLAAVAASSIEDAADQAALALDAGCRGVLLTPPFYFRGIGDDALFAWFGQLFDRLGSRARDMFAYHLPSVTGMPLTVTLIGRLKSAFPGVIIGVKDSSGQWSNTAALLAAHSDLMILVGDERDLAKAVREGGAGSICGLANVAPEILAGAAREGRDDPRIRRLVEAVCRFPVLAATKALIAHRTRDPAWRTMRPPLADLDAAESPRLIAAFEDALALAPA